MKLTVRELIEHLQNFPNQQEEVVASVWGREDFVYALEVLADNPEEYEVTQAQIDEADPLSMWAENAWGIERRLNHDAEYLNDEIFSLVLAALKEERKND